MDEGLPPPLPPPVPPPRSDETILLVLCYVGLLALVPYLVAKDAPLVRHQAREGLALAFLGVACAGIAVVPYVGVAGQAGLAGVLVLSILGLVKALERREWRAPVAADVADRLEL
jgi:fumarate reductase subunit D